MGEPTFLNSDKICFGDLEITLLTAENADQSGRDDILFMFKSIGYVEVYQGIKSTISSAKNILEVGVARGGGTAFLHRFFDAERVVGIDFASEPPLPLERYRARAGAAVQIYYGVDQVDRAKVTEIIQTEFPQGVDLIVDDASHTYEQTKATFEIAFPYLRTGGIYVIEDWNWSHHVVAQEADHYFADRDALSNLVFELVMAHGSTGIVDYIGLGSSMMWARRSGQQVHKENFRLTDYIFTRGRYPTRI